MQGLTLAALLLALPVSAKVVAVPFVIPSEVDLVVIEAAMRAAGHAVTETQCSGNPMLCLVILPDASPATASTLTPFFTASKLLSQRKADARAAEDALVEKFDAKTISPEEKDDLLSQLIKRLRTQ